MEICFLTSSHRATDTRLFDLEAKYLVKNGFSITIIGFHDRYEIKDNIKIIPIKKFNHSFFEKIFSIFTILKLSLSNPSKIYHFHDPELIIVGVFLKIIGKKVVYDIHEDYESKLTSKLKKFRLIGKFITKLWWVYEKISSSFFDYLVVADNHISQKFTNKNKIVIPNVPSEEFWKNISRERTDSNEFRIIYVGGISKNRGITQTLHAMDFVRHNNVTFNIIGDINDKELKKMIIDRKNVFWHGRLPWSEIGKRMINSDLGIVLLQPAMDYNNISGEGIVKLWEYLSVGLPVLISNFPNLEKLCSDLQFGMSVDPTDPKKIASAIDYLIDHPEERKKMGSNGQKAVREEYNSEFKLKDLLIAYEKILQ